jgi:gliding motility-associated-like protein
LDFESCAPVDEIYWFGNGTNGQGPIPLDIANNSNEVDTYNYDAFVYWNGCSSDTLTFEVDVFPAPSADFNFNPNPVIQGASATFSSIGNSSVDPIISWQWTADGLMPQFGSQTNYAFGDLNIHEVCLEITTANDCVAEVCKDVMVVAGAISAPNIFTPNLDGLNDVLEFPNLDFFPSNHLMVWNRWGNLVLDRENYKNNWDGGDLPGGTYYYILDVELLGEQSGYIFIVR